MQPPIRRTRPIERPLRPDPPLRYATLSDPILVKRAKDGDKQALEALCERHSPRVERLAQYLLDDPEDARDAAQEALAKLCTRLGQYRGEARFGTWLHRLVVNTCRDVAARENARRCEHLEEDARVSMDGDPAHAAALADLRAALAARLGEISPEQRKVVLLKDAVGLSFAEISAASGMPVGTAKCYAHRARASLRESLGESAAS